MKHTEKQLIEFCNYVLGFYGPHGIYDMNATLEQVKEATEILLKQAAGGNTYPVDFDSADRERVRDILIEKFGLKFPD